ncbi:MFS transporter-like protein [Mollisia scopiformis]|uniref:MFS transporter-like protein n=1 Tax=Mollisia scopiformis TaxID=149040 RepID=A0A194XHF9_MOLSC|nr:MFS transporter-like protein [Mollisia scopiformis]KUJ19598.1 MFS transporter-like protein [Mollisia scopiformis]
MTTLTLTEPSSSKFDIELQAPSSPYFPDKKRASISGGEHQSENRSEPKLGHPDVEDLREEAIPPDTAVEALQTWHSPRINMYRVFATFWSFFTVGMNDGSYGALVPHLEKYYTLSYTVVSLIFLSPFVGYSLSSILNNHVHIRLGQRGVAIIGPACHLVSYIIIANHPPYPVLVVMFIFVGFGNGLIDAAWCAWIGNMANANEVQGVLQACYALGATVAPLIATGLISSGGLGWYSFYYIMIATSTLELLTSSTTFWSQTGTIYAAENPRDPSSSSSTGRTREALKNKLTWIFALFIFGYMGAEISLGGWIVTFMANVRHANAFASGATATGFWAGMTVGRLGLSFLTAKLGEWKSVILYLSCAAALELIFWLVPNLVVSAVAIALMGVFMGPMFPTAIVLVAKLLPKSLHVGTIGFATAFGGSGGAIFPFIVGAIAQAKGVKTLQPVILALLVAIAGLWIVLPGARSIKGSMNRRGETETEGMEMSGGVARSE